MRNALLIFVIVFTSGQVSGQYYNSGQEPFKLKWQQIQSDNYHIVFHEGTDSLAFIFNKYLDYSLQKVSATLNHTPRKFPVVIHGNSVMSNGFVSWAPKRMEIITTSSLDASSELWLNHLALHETRHIVQLDKMYGSTWRFGNITLGQQAIGFKLLLTPLWFLEGDAVFVETAYSKAGRGRQASFYRHYLAHFAENNGSKFSYDKWLLGSYKDFIPNHYSLGYQLVGYTNYRYGSEVWSDALTSVSKKLFFTFPFHRSFKKSTNQTIKRAFDGVVSYHDSLWERFKPIDESTNFKWLLNKDSKNTNYVEYTYPHLLNDSTLISLVKSMSHRPKLVAIDLNSGSQKELHTPGITTSRVSYSNNTALWSQYSAHPRWDYVNYSEIWMYDIVRQKASRITHKTRFFNPVAFTNGTIAAIEKWVDGESYIAILDVKGNVVHRIRLQPTLELKEICKGDDSEIFARCASPNGMVVIRYNDIESYPDTLIGPIHNDISNLAYNNGTLYFTKTHNYRENIFAINILSNSKYKIAESTFGLSDISYNNMLVASKFTANGSYPVAVKPDSTQIYHWGDEEEPFFPTAEMSAERHIEVGSINHRLESYKYVRAKNLFNFHSWAPIYFNPMDLTDGNATFYPGITLISQNLTSSLTSSLGYSYNKTHGAHAHIEYTGWYPKFMASFNYGNEFAMVQHGPLAPNFLAYSGNPSMTARIRVRLPHTFTSGRIVTSANLGVSFIYTNNWTWDYRNEVYQKWSNAAEPYLSFYSITRMAHRDIRPRYGVQFYAATLNSPTSRVMGSASYVKAWLYLPGITTNHSLLLTGQGEKQDPKQYLRSLRYTPARGYERSLSESVITASIDYTFPAAYPDIAIGPVLYLKRLVGNIFFDNAIENRYMQTDQGLTPQKEKIHSLGIDLTADFHIFRTTYPLNMGYRGGYRVNEGDFFHGIIFSMSLESLMGYLPNLHNATINF